MTEHYAFLVMSAIQILMGSVLGPAWLIQRVQQKVASIPADTFAERLPGVDQKTSGQRFAARFRPPNTAIAVIGFLLLAWLLMFVPPTQWKDQSLVLVATGYLILQISPLVLLGWKGAVHNKALRISMADVKRKALLQRRRLFDFIAPAVVFIAILSYLLFVALVLYIRQHPFPGFGGLTNIYIISATWAFYAIVVYGILYGRKPTPLISQEERLYAMSMGVKVCIYSLIAVTLFASFQLLLSMVELRRWALSANSGFFALCMFLCYSGVIPRRQAKDSVLGPNGPLPPAAPDLPA